MQKVGGALTAEEGVPHSWPLVSNSLYYQNNFPQQRGPGTLIPPKSAYSGSYDKHVIWFKYLREMIMMILVEWNIDALS